MDDTCAVCADALEWVAYGPCLHKEVCSTCIIRLRFICNDFHCCICKSESNTIFVTKALGDCTRMISDFKGLGGVNGKEGKVGECWYHEGTKAYFDDFDHYKMIKAMCRLSCNVCNKKDGGSKEFNSVEQLKGHLFHKHRLFMCGLCLEGRKIFTSEQKLYNRAQWTQHVRTGDSVVDGSESERGRFTGHPMCEFCENRFYGDNELYLHMSTEHFTCHICPRQHPEQYEYFNS
uniref:RING-type domain-containing protein n=1 Tax=Populus trichocarpa TaxID=3694 RepID=A0A3N7EVA9_POPTR